MGSDGWDPGSNSSTRCWVLQHTCGTASPLASRPLPFVLKVPHASKTDSLHRSPYTPACVSCLILEESFKPTWASHAPAPHWLSLAWKSSLPHLDPDSYPVPPVCVPLPRHSLPPGSNQTTSSPSCALRMGHFSLEASPLPYMGLPLQGSSPLLRPPCRHAVFALLELLFAASPTSPFSVDAVPSCLGLVATVV